MIVIDKVSKRYKRKKVLDKVSFKVESGEFVSIVGPSGAGKTTLLHAMIGAKQIDSGGIWVDEYRVEQLSPSEVQDYRRKVGIIFQDFKLLDQKTVFENVAFGLEVCGYPKSFVHKRVTEVLRVAGLEEHRNHFPAMLSGGEKQRTAIARALAHAPDLLFADEPTGNLDPENSAALAKLLVRINKGGTTVILSTHDRDIVDLIQKRVISLKEGKVVRDRKKAGYS